MKEVITVINQKGGVGKSTTVQNIGTGLKHLHKKKVLFIDLDAQGNLSYSLGANMQHLNSFDVITGSCNTKEAIQKTPQGDLICSSPSLSNADSHLKDTGKEFKLREAIETIKNEYDYILIDTPPSLGVLSVNALTASDSVIIPSQADIFSLQGIGQLSNTIEVVKKYCNPSLTIKGLVLTRYSSRSVLSRDIASMLDATAKQLNTKLFKTTIREGIAIKEAQANKENLFTYAPKSNPTTDYKNLVKEVM